MGFVNEVVLLSTADAPVTGGWASSAKRVVGDSRTLTLQRRFPLSITNRGRLHDACLAADPQVFTNTDGSRSLSLRSTSTGCTAAPRASGRATAQLEAYLRAEAALDNPVRVHARRRPGRARVRAAQR